MSATLYFCTTPKEGEVSHFIPMPERWEVNMCNSNAREFFARIGLDVRFEDREPAPIEELLTSCRCFIDSELPSLVDAGRPTVEVGHGFYMCGVEPGYYSRRARQVINSIAYARGRGATHYYWL